MKVKICGITNLDDALLCSELGADALGFIFFDQSKRFIDYANAKNIIREIPTFVTKVGVFDKVNEVSHNIGLNMVQLHGDENPSDVDKINLPVIKSFRVSEKLNFPQLKLFGNCSLLLDTYSDNQLGGTGIPFDWKLIPSELRSKVILAGGISTTNIESIFNNIKPQAVDLSSSVEAFPGKKDELKLREFFKKLNHLRYKTC
jgi:phosphoribosylanthranilate isomerase